MRGCDDPLKPRVGHRPHNSGPINRHEECRRVADENPRRLRIHRERRHLHGTGGGQRGLQAIQRNRPGSGRTSCACRPSDRRHRCRKAWGNGSCENQVLQRHHPRHAIHLRPRRSPDHTEGFLTRALRLGADHGAESSRFPVQELTCGWYTSSVAPGSLNSAATHRQPPRRPWTPGPTHHPPTRAPPQTRTSDQPELSHAQAESSPYSLFTPVSRKVTQRPRWVPGSPRER